MPENNQHSVGQLGFVMKKRIKSLIAIMLGTLCLITGCSDAAGTTDAGDSEQDNGIEIGMCFDSFVIERWQRDRDVFVSYAKDLDATVNVQNANGDVEEQRKQIEYFIKKGVDALVIIPVDCDAIADLVTSAKAKGIKIISYDRLILNADVDMYISFDNAKVGAMMGKAVAAKPVNKVLMLNGPTADHNVSMIETEFRKEMATAGIEILDVFYVDGWTPEFASDYMYENIDKAREADAIMCGNDDLASAVIRVLSVKKLAGEKYVVGQDADLLACQHIVEGTQLMTVYKPVEKLASEAARVTVAMIKGDEIEGTEQINDGKYDVPYIAIEPVSVDASNMDSVIIESGFHTKEDVYLNVNK